MVTALSDLTGTRNPLDLATVALQETRSERLIRYELNWAYYRNQMYDADIIDAVSGKAARRATEQLYAKIKAMYNVCTFCVNIDAAAVLAPPVVVTSESPALEAAIVDVWKWSKLQSHLQRLLLWGATYGDCYLRLAAENTAQPRIVIHPPSEFDILVDPHNPETILRGELSYNFDQGERRHTYTMYVYPDRYETYLDDEPYSFIAGQPWQWPNTLGFVPVVPLRLIDFGEVYGASTFQEVLPQLDAVNELTSQVAEIVRMHADPILIARNIKAGDITKGETTKGETKILYLNRQGGADVEASLEFLEWAGGNLQYATQFVQDVKHDIEEVLPEWHIKRVREQSAPSGYSVSLQLSEMQMKIGSMRRNALEALHMIDAMAMVAMGKAKDLYDVPHDIALGTIMPRDRQLEQALAAADLAANAIDRAEYLRRQGYDSGEIEGPKGLLAKADAEREAQMLVGAAWPADNVPV
jgi:hypothetical protein